MKKLDTEYLPQHFHSFSLKFKELKLGLCSNLEEWEWAGGGGRFKREGTCVYLWLVHVDV